MPDGKSLGKTIKRMGKQKQGNRKERKQFLLQEKRKRTKRGFPERRMQEQRIKALPAEAQAFLPPFLPPAIAAARGKARKKQIQGRLWSR
jgi:hypothetical protein